MLACAHGDCRHPDLCAGAKCALRKQRLLPGADDTPTAVRNMRALAAELRRSGAVACQPGDPCSLPIALEQCADRLEAVARTFDRLDPGSPLSVSPPHRASWQLSTAGVNGSPSENVTRPGAGGVLVVFPGC